MREEIFQKLKQAYSPLGLGDALLQARAEMLNELGFVTAENVDEVVAKQKASLEAIQRANDSRVTEAIKKHDEDLKKKADKAREKAEQEAAKLKAEEEAKKAEEEAKKKAEEVGGLTPELKAYFEEVEKKRTSDFLAQMEAQKKMYEKSISELTATVTGLREDSKRAEQEKARAERQAKILNKAKELGIPQTRIDEGFVISDDADDYAIGSYLGTVKKNIDAQKLPSNNHWQLGDGEPTKEEVADVAGKLLGL